VEAETLSTKRLLVVLVDRVLTVAHAPRLVELVVQIVQGLFEIQMPLPLT